MTPFGSTVFAIARTRSRTSGGSASGNARRCRHPGRLNRAAALGLRQPRRRRVRTTRRGRSRPPHAPASPLIRTRYSPLRRRPVGTGGSTHCAFRVARAHEQHLARPRPRTTLGQQLDGPTPREAARSARRPLRSHQRTDDLDSRGPTPGRGPRMGRREVEQGRQLMTTSER